EAGQLGAEGPSGVVAHVAGEVPPRGAVIGVAAVIFGEAKRPRHVRALEPVAAGVREEADTVERRGYVLRAVRAAASAEREGREQRRRDPHVTPPATPCRARPGRAATRDRRRRAGLRRARAPRRRRAARPRARSPCSSRTSAD